MWYKHKLKAQHFKISCVFYLLVKIISTEQLDHGCFLSSPAVNGYELFAIFDKVKLIIDECQLPLCYIYTKLQFFTTQIVYINLMTHNRISLCKTTIRSSVLYGILRWLFQHSARIIKHSSGTNSGFSDTYYKVTVRILQIRKINSTNISDIMIRWVVA